MKKIISVLCVVALMLSFTTICASAWSISDNEGYDDEFNPRSYIGYVGDVDASRNVNITDVTYIQMYIAEALDLRGANRVLADVDQSDATNIMDATCIQLWLADLPVDAPVYHQLGDDEMDEHWCSYSITTIPNKCQEGYIEYECYECWDYYTSHYKDAVHNWEVIEVVEPGCEDGYTEVVCKDCGEEDRIDYIEGTGHDMGEWQIVKEPEIGVDGEKRCYCSKCDYYVSQSIDMLVEGNQDAIAAAREMLFLLQATVGYFDSVDEVFEPKNDGRRGVKWVGYLPLYWDDKYEQEEDTGLFVFKRADLEEMLLKYLDTTYDWKSLDSTEGDYGDKEYYDEATDTVRVGLHLGAGGYDKLKVTRCIDNGDGTYTMILDARSVGSPEWQIHAAEITVKETEHGYPAVSFICCHDWSEWSVLKPSTIYLEGTEIRHCNNCFDYEERVTEKLPSDYTEEELTELSAVATTAEDMFHLFKVTVRFFDSVDEIFEYDEFNLKELAYLKADRESDDGYLIYKRSDLDDALLSYFGRTYDWTQLNDYGEDDIYETEYYDADTDTVVRYSFGGYGVAETWTMKTITKTSDDTCEVEVEIYDADFGETTNAVLSLVETEHGYNAVSLKVVD